MDDILSRCLAEFVSFYYTYSISCNRVHEKKNAIALAQRPHILTTFKQILYASTVDEMKEN